MPEREKKYFDIKFLQVSEGGSETRIAWHIYTKYFSFSFFCEFLVLCFGLTEFIISLH